MTETEWLAGADPATMLRQLGRRASQRKRRLFGCASCGHIWELIADERSRAAVQIAEQFADGLAGSAELTQARAAAKAVADEQAAPPYVAHWAAAACYCAAMQNAGNAMKAWHSAASAAQMQTLAQRGRSPMAEENLAATKAAWANELPRYAALLRDMFQLFPVRLDPAWRTATVLAVATHIYEERKFENMPILADALEDGGCTSPDILNHCRQPGPHAKGCWCVDLILDKQ